MSYRAIQGDQRIGLLLPCTVAVSALTEKRCNGFFANPFPRMHLDPYRKNEIVQEVARLAYEGLMRAFATLSME